MLRSHQREREADERLSSPARHGPGPREVGRALRNERVRQGLSTRDVARQLGLPEEQIRAAESGAVHHGDQLATLKTVRRFADLLGLPGDRYALAILEQWPSAAPARSPSLPHREDPTAVTPAVTRDDWLLPGEMGDLGPLAYTDFVVFDAPVDTGDATGIVPAVPIGATADVVRHRSMPWPLRAAAGVLVVAVVAGGGLLAVDQLHPSWLQAFGLDRAAAAPSKNTAPTTAPGRHAADSPATKPAVADVLHARATSGTAASVDVGTAPATVTVSSAGAPCWVDVTAPTAAAPLFTGVLDAGQTRSFTVAHGAAVELGSAAGRVSVTSSSGHLATYRPPAAPFTLSVHTAS